MADSSASNGRVNRPYPRKTLEQALRVPQSIREHNNGQPWKTDQVAEALGIGAKTGNFYYITAASRDFGFTEGTRETAEISLTELGRKAVFFETAQEELDAKKTAFLNIDIFKKVLEHYGGNNLPDKRFLTNALQNTFGLDPSTHDEFVELFDKNCQYLGIGKDYSGETTASASPKSSPNTPDTTTTVAQPKVSGTEHWVCFVIMPFTERDERHTTGFFEEVLKSLLAPAIAESGFEVKTALRQGSDVIQSTIVNDLLQADLVVADLTEHNPNVLFELGMRMAEDKPVALIRAKGTGPIFDVDNMLRVEEYNPNLWPSTVEKDIPKLRDHIKATWESKDSAKTYMKILRDRVDS